MLKRLIVYVIIGVVITAGPLYYVNNVLLAGTGSEAAENISALISIPIKAKVAVPLNAKYLSLAYNRRYICYVDGGILYIKDADSGKVYKTVTEENPVVFAMPMDDRNIIMYFTYDSGKLRIMTYNIDNNEKANHRPITIKDFQRIRDVKYSSLTNMIYIDAEVGQGKRIFDKVYKVDIMEYTQVYVSNKVITSDALLRDRDVFIYQDINNNVYIKGRIFKYKNNRKFKLLGTDNDDNIYLSPIGSPGQILAVKNNTVKNTIYEEDENYTGSMNKDGIVYLIYSDYMLNLIDNKKINIKPGTEIADVVSGSMLLVNSSNEAIIEKAS